ncbi:putative nucleotidyltransferase, ribonuclease H [Tanacetum coccineum]
MNSPPNHEWEEGLDIDDFDLLLTLVIRPTNNTHIVPEITTTQTLFSSQNNQVDNCVVKPIRIIPGPAVIEDVGEDDDFTRTLWLSAIDYVNVDGGILTGCFGDVKKFLKHKKLEQIVAVIKSCTSNALGDLIVTLKELSGTISGTIHYKVLTEERFVISMDKSKMTRKQSKTSKHGHENQKSTKPKPEKPSLSQNQPKSVKDGQQKSTRPTIFHFNSLSFTKVQE